MSFLSSFKSQVGIMLLGTGSDIRAAKAQLGDLAGGAEQPMEQPVASIAPAAKSETTHRYEPVWDSRHEAITTYICAPDRAPTNANGEPVPLRALTIKQRTRIELSAISAGAAQLNTHLESADRFLLGVKLSFETLGSPYGRMEIAGLCRNLPAACRQHLAFLITDIPDGVAHSRMADFVMTLGHFGRIIATVPSGSRNLSAYQGLGLWGIAMDFGTVQSSPDRIAADIAQLSAAGRNMRLATLAYGVQDRVTLAHAYASSIQIMHGLAIGAALATPKCVTRLRWSELAPHRAQRAAERAIAEKARMAVA